MKKKHLFAAAICIPAAAWCVFGLTKHNNDSPAQNKSANSTNPARPSQPKLKATSYEEIPRITHHECEDSNCAHHHKVDTSPIIADRNRKTWPQTVIDHLEKTHPTSKAGIKHLSRAISYNDFEQLNPEQLARLVRYSEFTQQATTTELPHLCWAEDTLPIVQSSFNQVRALAITEDALDDEPQFAQQGNDRWTFTATDGSTGPEGTPVTITWSFVPDGTTVPGLNGAPPEPSNLIATLNSTYGSSTTGNLQDAPWFELFAASFADWGEATGNTYIFEPNDDGSQISSFSSPGVLGTRGDVRISGRFIDGNSSTLAFNFFPNGGDMVIDTADNRNFTNDDLTKRRFQNVITHEHGHGLGISHVCPINQTKLMEPSVNTLFTGVQFDDLLTSQGLYGDSSERSDNSNNNDSISTASQLGTVIGSRQVNNLSISDTGDIDIYKFNVTSGQRLTLNISPTDEAPYLEGAQNANNSCSPGSIFNPQNRQNLSVRILAPNGTTVLATANSAPIGEEEIINDLLLPQTGEDYFIEITGGGENSAANNNAQVYSITLDVENASTLSGSNYQIIQEGCTPANLISDPGEVITAQITVTNTGINTISSPSVSISGSTNFTALDASTKSLSSLAVGDSTTVNFQFKIDGNCGDEETLVFTLDTGEGVSTFSQNIALGTLTTVLDENFENLSTEFMFQGSGTSQWGVDSTNPINGTFSLSSLGSNSGSPFFLLTPTRTVNGSSIIFTFNHNYDFENTIDGGTLQVQIDNGSWQDWINAGGAFTSNGYNGTVDGSPAWTGSSGGTITTIATLPGVDEDTSIRIRWRAFYDSSTANTSAGWNVDNIILATGNCCEGNIPMVSISSTDSIVQENDTTNTGEFAITSSATQATNLDIAYTVSGSATAGSDYQALAGIATITAGQQLATIPVTAIRDSLAEGNETLILNLSPSPDYAIQTGTASVTIEDLPFDAWRNTFFGANILNTGETEDFDFDGLENLLEYALGKDPLVPNPEMPFTTLQNGGTQLVLSYERDVSITDIQYIVEVSPTLGEGTSPWVTTGVTINEGPIVDGKRTVTATTNVSGIRQFMRLRVVRN